MASEGLRYPLEGVGTPGESQGVLTPHLRPASNPSIEHLVAVILKYPRREESGRRMSLNPGPIGQRYTGPRIWTSENASSRHYVVNKPLINAPNSFEWHHGHGVDTLEEHRLARRRNLYVSRGEQSPSPPLPRSAC